MDANGWAAVAAAISALISAVALGWGIVTWRAQNAVGRRDAILAQALKSMESAYGALTSDGRHVPPLPDRLSWLMAARHLLRYQDLRDELDSFQAIICDEQEEIWRHKFFLAVSPLSNQTGYFTQKKPQPSETPPVQLESVVVVLAFSEWRNGRDDPLDKIEINEILRRTSILTHRYHELERELGKLACAPTTPP